MPMTLQIDYRNLACAIVASLGVAQFLAILFWGMQNYPDSYQWTTHFISDLGRLRTPKGADNSLISEAFRISTILLGLAILPFFLAVADLFQVGRFPLQLLGLLSAIGMIGLGQTPYDQYTQLHHFSLALWIVPMTAMVILLPVLIHMESGGTRFLTVLSGVLVIFTLAYACAGFRSGYVVMQKLVVSISLLWLIAVMTTFIVVARHTLSARQKLVTKQAEWYGNRIRQRHRR